MNGPRLYTEPQPTIAHLYEQRGDGFWYPKECSSACCVPLLESGTFPPPPVPPKSYAELENENRRMITAFEAIALIANDMLDPVRRAGPTSKSEEKSQ